MECRSGQVGSKRPSKRVVVRAKFTSTSLPRKVNERLQKEGSVGSRRGEGGNNDGKVARWRMRAAWQVI